MRTLLPRDPALEIGWSPPLRRTSVKSTTGRMALRTGRWTVAQYAPRSDVRRLASDAKGGALESGLCQRCLYAVPRGARAADARTVSMALGTRVSAGS